jgi:outer membrane protein assembly factor BamB
MMQRNLGCLAVICLAITGLSTAVAMAIAWPGYRGPSGDGITTEKILRHWPSNGPKVLWTVPLGEAFGSFAVAGDKAFVFEKSDESEACAALDATTGKQLWLTPIDRTIHDNQGGDGPRSTPAVDGDKVYVMGTFFKLFCLNAADGKVLWSHDLISEFGGKDYHWGNAASPLVEGDLVIVAGGGRGESIIAFKKETGEVAWKELDEKITHATATPATIDGVHQDIFFMQSGLVSIIPETGEVLWKQPFPYSVSTAASPVVEKDIVYCSAGYGVGAGVYRITKNGDKFSSTQIWRMPGGDVNHWSTPVIQGDYIYGLFGFKQFKTMPLKCIELATGREVWSKPGFGQGGLVMVGDDLLIQADTGQLVLVEATPKAYHALAIARPLGGKCWTMPVVADGKIYTRSTKQGVCLDVEPKE